MTWPAISGPALNEAGLGASFLAQNAGKKSVELNLKDPDDRASFVDLIGVADVLVENYRAGVRPGWDSTGSGCTR